ncbi:putative two-component sensor histidine kinase domain protein, partial [Bacteroides fragilis str. 20793-3]
AQEILLQIHISTPWYLTWWAWLSYITISISVTYFIWREKSSRRTLAILQPKPSFYIYSQTFFNPAI